MINKRIQKNGCLQIWNVSSRVQLEDKFYSYARHVLFSAYRTLLRLFVIQLLRQYLAHLQDSFSFDITQYLTHFQDSFSFNCYVGILCSYRILFHRIITLVSYALLGFFFIRLLCYYLAHCRDSFSSDCYVSVLWNFRILFLSIVMYVSCAPLGFFYIRLLSQYRADF